MIKKKILVCVNSSPNMQTGASAILRLFIRKGKFRPTYLVCHNSSKNRVVCKINFNFFKFLKNLLLTFHIKNLIRINYWKECFINSADLKIPAPLQNKKFDYIYTWGGDALWIKSVLIISKRNNLPIVAHFMDNHFESQPERLGFFENERINLNKKLIYNASKIFVISKKMQNFIYTNFKKNSFVAAVFPKNHKVFTGKRNIHKTLNIGWFGSIDESQRHGIINFMRGCQGLRIPVKLTAFVARREDWKKLPAFVEVKKHPCMQSQSSMEKSVSNLNALLLAYDFSKYTKIHYKFSLPAKLSFYLKTKLPIIGFGPKSIYPIEILRKNKCGLVINTQNPRLIIKNMNKIIKRPKSFLNQKNKTKILKTHFKMATLDD